MVSVRRMLSAMAESFNRKTRENASFIAQISIPESHESWHVIIGRSGFVSVRKGKHPKATFLFSTSANSLRLMFDGKMTGLTAAATTKSSEPAPLEFKLGRGLRLTTELRQQLLSFIQHFFNRSDPEVIYLGQKYSRLVHGASAIALYYQPGFRSAWYLVKKGQRLNQPGDTNPFPQAFTFVSGNGFAKIGNEVVRAGAGMSYYIPPGQEHMVWNRRSEPLVLIWNAWGKGA